MENETHRPFSLLVWPLRQRCVECGAERQMAGIFPLTWWQMSDGHIVVDCAGRGEDPRPRYISDYGKEYQNGKR
jgi:hypothetical protein